MPFLQISPRICNCGHHILGVVLGLGAGCFEISIEKVDGQVFVGVDQPQFLSNVFSVPLYGAIADTQGCGHLLGGFSFCGPGWPHESPLGLDQHNALAILPETYRC